MRKLIDGVEHIDLEEAATVTGYDVGHLRKLAWMHHLEATKQGHYWWVTKNALKAYRKAKPQRKPRTEAGRRREGKA